MTFAGGGTSAGGAAPAGGGVPAGGARPPGRSRVALTLVCAFVLVPASARAQDALLRTIACAEAVAPIAILLVQGVDSPAEAGVLGGSVLLFSVPNLVLMIAEANGNAPATRISRLSSAGVGLAAAAGSLGIGAAVMFGAFPELGLEPYAGSILAISVPALLAGLVDLVPYAIESAEPAGTRRVASQAGVAGLHNRGAIGYISAPTDRRVDVGPASCQGSSGAEQLTRNEQVVSSNLTLGFLAVQPIRFNQP